MSENNFEEFSKEGEIDIGDNKWAEESEIQEYAKILAIKTWNDKDINSR